MLKNELKKQSNKPVRLKTRKHTSLTNFKAEKLNQLFALVRKDILKEIFGNDGKQLKKKFNLSENRENLAKCILNDIWKSILCNHKQHTEIKLIEQKTLEILAKAFAKWIENILHEIIINDD